MELNTRKLFHEVVIQMIQGASRNELETFRNLLTQMIITEGHDGIISAWFKRCDEMEWRIDDTFFVARDIRSQQPSGLKEQIRIE